MNEITIKSDNSKVIAELIIENARLHEALGVTDKILAERQRVLEAIPQCEEHGFCVPHALEWIADRINEKHIPTN